ncbi:MAG: transcription initiation factor IIE [Clostridiaceae bacterium]|jgi:hypothetical protein|nr:transcription initiation factor IIE [Clostridiaceae bacterium]
MRYQDAFVGSREEFGDFIRKAVPDLFAGRLVVEGKQIQLPEDADIDYKVKYDEGIDGGSVTIKASWDIETEEEDTSQDD